eukprot:s1998_g5.t1
MARLSSLLKAAVLACALLAFKDLAFVGPAESPKLRGQEVRTARPEPGRVALEERGAEQAFSREDVPKVLLAFASGLTPTAAVAYTTAEEALRPWYSIAPWYGGALYVVTLIVHHANHCCCEYSSDGTTMPMWLPRRCGLRQRSYSGSPTSSTRRTTSRMISRPSVRK